MLRAMGVDHATNPDWIGRLFGRIHFEQRADLGLWVAAVQTYDGVAVGVGSTHAGSLDDLARQLRAGREEVVASLLG